MRSPLVIPVALAIACASWTPTAQGQEKEKPVKPLISLSGSRSQMTKGGYYRVESAEAWKRLWRSHTVGAGQTRTADPAAESEAEVDFGRCMIVAAFEGKLVNCDGYQVHSVLETAEKITVRLQRGTYSTGIGVEPRPTSAWGIFLLPRSAKPLQIELENRSKEVQVEAGPRKEDPNRWTRVAELKAGDDKVTR